MIIIIIARYRYRLRFLPVLTLSVWTMAILKAGAEVGIERFLIQPVSGVSRL